MRGYTAADAYKMAVVWGLAAALLAVIVTRDALPTALVVVVAVCCFAAVVATAYRFSSPDTPADTTAPAHVSPAPTPSPPASPATLPDVAPATSESAAPASDGLEKGAAPAFLSAPPDDGGDDLKRIKGVGPKLAAQLNRMGVYRFTQIAAWTPAEIAWVDDNLEGFKGRVTRDGWVDQAQVLAHGGTTEFAARVDAGDVPSSQG